MRLKPKLVGYGMNIDGWAIKIWSDCMTRK